MRDRKDLELVAESLAEIFRGVFDALDDLVARTARLLEHRPPSVDLAALDPTAIQLVQGSELIVGAGYVAAPGALRDTDYWLQWWADYDVPRTGHPQRLHVELDPGSELFREYVELPWFAVPAESRERHVTGPYVDYLCTDEDTFTFTVPVVSRASFRGVVGADVYARDVERLALPELRRLGEPAVLLNGANRVVAAVSSAHVPGDLVRAPLTSGPPRTDTGADDHWTVLPLPGMPFAVAVGPARAGA
jgi:hypothetical protein